MTKIIEPGQWEEKEGYKQKQVAIHDIPFGYYDRFSKRKYIIYTQTTSSYLSARSRDSIHFGSGPREMGAELYLLDNGEYEWTITTGEDGSGELSRGRISVSGPRTSIYFTIPQRRLCVLRIRRLEVSDNDESMKKDK
jgi:hypothetical protein